MTMILLIPVCPDPCTQNPVSLSDATFDAHGNDDTNVGSVTPDVIAIKTVGDALHDDDTNMISVPLSVSEMQSEACHFLYKITGWIHGRFGCWSSCWGIIC